MYIKNKATGQIEFALDESDFAKNVKASKHFEVLPADSKEVAEFIELENQANLAVLAESVEREAIDEVIREQFANQIAERIKEKQAKLANRKNAK
jgi:hypothetical protein